MQLFPAYVRKQQEADGDLWETVGYSRAPAETHTHLLIQEIIYFLALQCIYYCLLLLKSVAILFIHTSLPASLSEEGCSLLLHLKCWQQLQCTSGAGWCPETWQYIISSVFISFAHIYKLSNATSWAYWDVVPGFADKTPADSAETWPRKLKEDIGAVSRRKACDNWLYKCGYIL